jgi:hypothetical protein
MHDYSIQIFLSFLFSNNYLCLQKILGQLSRNSEYDAGCRKVVQFWLRTVTRFSLPPYRRAVRRSQSLMGTERSVPELQRPELAHDHSCPFGREFKKKWNRASNRLRISSPWCASEQSINAIRRAREIARSDY